jgi:hypothetical protein
MGPSEIPIASSAAISSAPPQQQQSTAAGGVDIISQLITSANDADAKAAAATKAASIPISGGHQQPTAINMPGAGRSYAQQPLDNSQTYGKHQATMQGIANLGKSVANVVGQVQQQRDAKKTQELSVNIEHLMGAVNSEDQAKQILAQDPNNQQAKDQLAKAQAIQGEVLNDDKNRKAIAKAFNINFVDPSKNNTPEHAAMKQATDSYAKQFADKLPSNMAPNQAAIAAAKTAETEAKATHDTVNKIIPAIIASTSRQDVAQTAAQQRDTASKREYDAQVYKANQSYMAVIQGANIHVQGMLQAAKMRDDTLLSTAQMRIDALMGKDGKSPKAQQEAQRAFDSISKTLSGYQTQINETMQNRAKVQSENPKSPQIEVYNKRINFLENQSILLGTKQNELANRLSAAGEAPVVNDAATPGPNIGGTNAAGPNYIVDGDDNPDDPEHYDQ